MDRSWLEETRTERKLAQWTSRYYRDPARTDGSGRFSPAT
jgi:hypothetical protein